MDHILHVGHEKCASTWLEQYLFPNIPDTQPLWIYPWNSSEWARTIREDIRHADPLDFSAEELRSFLKKHTEDLDGPSTGIWAVNTMTGSWLRGSRDRLRYAKRLRDVFGNPEILMIIREQTDAIPSYYSQYLKLGGTLSLEGFLEAETHQTEFRLEHLRYDRTIPLYQDLFGEDHLRVVPFELIKEDPQEFADAICQSLGFNPPTIPDEGKTSSNSGYDPSEYGAIRALNRASTSQMNPGKPFTIFDLDNPDESALTRMAKPYGVARRIGACISRLRRGERGLDEETREELLEYYRRGNRQVDEGIEHDLESLGYPV